MNSKIIESLRLQELIRGDLAIFCGAGISLNSGLPLANQLKWHILEKLADNKVDIKDIEEIYEAPLPFEAFMETIFTNYHPPVSLDNQKLDETDDSSKKAIREAALALVALVSSLDGNMNASHADLLQIYRMGQPNSNHLLIAELMKHGYVKNVLTTNFDLLVETALEILNQEDDKMVKGCDFQVFYDEEQFAKVDPNSLESPVVFKIHGSAESLVSIRTTLEHVANRTFSENRAGVIDYIFGTGGSHKKVLVLGYSCSDVFDITPRIEEIDSSDKEVILVCHSKNVEPQEKAIRDISKTLYINGAFLFSTGLDFVSDLKQGIISHSFRHEFETQKISLSPNDLITIVMEMESYWWRIYDSGHERTYIVIKGSGTLGIYNGTRNPFTRFAGWVVSCDTDRFVRLFWDSHRDIVGPYQDAMCQEQIWKKSIEKWCSNLTNEKGSKDRCFLISLLMSRIGNYKKMKAYTERCIKLVESSRGDDQLLIPHLYNNMIYACQALGDPNLAEKWQRKATKYMER